MAEVTTSSCPTPHSGFMCLSGGGPGARSLQRRGRGRLPALVTGAPQVLQAPSDNKSCVPSMLMPAGLNAAASFGDVTQHLMGTSFTRPTRSLPCSLVPDVQSAK